MPITRQGSIHLFRFSGIDVFLHWSWFLVAVYEINARAGLYSSVGWNVLEYLALFVIVTIHEFGHALACRQVGRNSEPDYAVAAGWRGLCGPTAAAGRDPVEHCGGAAGECGARASFVAAGHMEPLVGMGRDHAECLAFVGAVSSINWWLLVFNILPIYPLDGGQILRSLLWFVLGRARSLMVATVLGLLGAAGFVVLAFMQRDIWLGAISLYLLMICWGGLQQARALLRFAKLPRRDGFACPRCKGAPPVGDFWKCGNCGQAFDTFATQAACPKCGVRFGVTKCMECGGSHPMNEWVAPVLGPRGL